jgi:hypothetical protein
MVGKKYFVTLKSENEYYFGTNFSYKCDNYYGMEGVNGL